MSYEPLHHKYRPQTFKDLVGQVAIATTLINAIELAKIAPAYLFTGPRGTGKTSSARIFAKSLNCLAYDRPTAIPCGKCEVCSAIAVGNALDVIEIDAASNTGVDNIREIIERSRFAPVQSRYKVYAIDECHMLTTAAFNALLKTLEEPPSRVVFILATTDPQRVLPTIISRCQRFDYRRIPLEAMVNHLQYIAKEEEINITLEALTLVAQIANGGLRDAESLLDQLSLFPDTITLERVWDLVGVVPEKDLLALLIAIRKQDVEAILAQCRNLLDRGREPLVLLQNLASFYLNLLIVKTAPTRQDLVAITENCWQQLVEEAKYWDVAKILQGQQQLKDGEIQIKNTTQPRLWLEVNLLSLLERATTSSQQNTVVSSSSSLSKQEQIIEKLAENNLETKIIPFPNQSLKEEEKSQRISILENSVTAKEEINLTSQEQSINELKTKKYLEHQEEDFTFKSRTTKPVDYQKINTANESETENKSLVVTTQQAAIWQQVIDCIHPPMTQALLRQQCHLISLNEFTAVVGISSAPLLKVNQGKIPNIEAAFAKVCQRKIKVVLEVAPPPEGEKKNSNLGKNSFSLSLVPNNSDLKPSPLASSTPIKDNLVTTPTPEKSKVFSTDKQDNVTTIIQEDLEESLQITESTIEESPEKTDFHFVINSSEENADDFTKAVELMAKKFDGEIIELTNSSLLATTFSEEKIIQEVKEIPIKQQQVIIKREAIADYEDDDVPF